MKRVFKRGKKKEPSYAGELQRIQEMYSANPKQELTFGQILKIMDTKLYDRMNNQRYRVQAALRKLIELGELQKEETDDSTIYKKG